MLRGLGLCRPYEYGYKVLSEVERECGSINSASKLLSWLPNAVHPTSDNWDILPKVSEHAFACGPHHANRTTAPN